MSNCPHLFIRGSNLLAFAFTDFFNGQFCSASGMRWFLALAASCTRAHAKNKAQPERPNIGAEFAIIILALDHCGMLIKYVPFLGPCCNASMGGCKKQSPE